MKYMLLMMKAANDSHPPMHEWTSEEVRASGEHMQRIHEELVERGELVGTERLAGPEAAKIVVAAGGDPVISDGPFAETKEFLAGYWYVDVDGEHRAIDIAARTSAAPGPGGRPIGYPIEVRAVMGWPDPEL